LQGVIDICFSGKYSKQEMLAKIQRKGGLISYLGTDDIKEIERRIKNGDKKANLVYNAMIYQIAKEIGAMLVALKGKVTAIIITGGIAHQRMLVNRLKSWLRFINKPIMVFAGEEEMSALAEGAGKVILKLKKAQQY
ncbi:MAG: ROK family protein, partial [candidate division WOR-3 bacterium]